MGADKVLGEGKCKFMIAYFGNFGAGQFAQDVLHALFITIG